MSTISSAGQLNLTVVDGSTYTGAQAADGSWYIVLNDGSTYTGYRHKCGAINAVVNEINNTDRAPNGSMYVKTNVNGNGYTPSSGAGSTGLSWVVNLGNPPDVAFNLKANQAWNKSTNIVSTAASNLTVTRSTSGYVNDSGGNWTNVGINLPRISDLGLLTEESRTNTLRNNSMQGAVVKADNVELLVNGNFASGIAGWTTNSSGGGSASIATGVATLVGDGTTFNNYIAQRITGLIPGRNYTVIINTSSNSTFGCLVDSVSAGSGSLLNTNIIVNSSASTLGDRAGFTAPAGGAVWVTIAKFSGVTGTINSLSVQDGERVENGNFTSNPINVSQVTVQNGWQWSNNVGTGTVVYNGAGSGVTATGDGTHAAVVGTLAIPTIVGGTYTITYDNSGATATLVVGTTALSNQILTTATTLGTGQKLQFTATSTTSFVSFTKSAAVAATFNNVSIQSAGIVPTNWTNSLVTGINSEVVSLQTVKGIDTISIRYFGTSGANASINLQPDTQVIAAVTGQLWNFSAFTAITGTAPTTVGFEIDELDSGAVFLSGTQANFVFTPTLIRYDTTRTFNQATTARGRGYYRFQLVSGNVYDFTLTAGWPQFELGGHASSPIRTTNANVTRSSDVVRMTTSPVFGAAYTMYGRGTPQTPNSYSTVQALLEYYTDVSNRTSIRRNAGTATPLLSQAGGTAISLTDAGTWQQATSGKLTAALAAADQSISFNNDAATNSASATLQTTPTSVTVGSGSSGSTFFWNGFVEYFAIWATQRVPNVNLI